MKSGFILFLLIFVFIFSQGPSCNKNVDCHSFSVEISYDFVEQLTVQTIGGLAPFSYKWAGGLGASSIAIAPGPGTYSVTVTDLNKCAAIANYTIH